MSAHPDGLIGLLDSCTAEYEADGLTPAEATVKALTFNLHGLTNSIIVFGSTGADMPNDMLERLCGGLLDTLAWVTARTEAQRAWATIDDDYPFDGDV